MPKTPGTIPDKKDHLGDWIDSMSLARNFLGPPRAYAFVMHPYQEKYWMASLTPRERWLLSHRKARIAARVHG